MTRPVATAKLIRQFLASREQILSERTKIISRLNAISEALYGPNPAPFSDPAEFSAPAPVEKKARRKQKRLPSPGTKEVSHLKDVVESPVLDTDVSTVTAPAAVPAAAAAVLEVVTIPKPAPLSPGELAAILNMALNERPAKSPTAKSLGIPPITEKQLVALAAILPPPRHIQPEVARETIMSLSLGCVLSDPEVMGFLLNNGIQTVGHLCESLGKLDQLKRNERALILARLYQHLQKALQRQPNAA
jgi:hypothetical protein